MSVHKILPDGYKTSHIVQYPEKTEYVFSYFTPRTLKYMPGVEKIVAFGFRIAVTDLLLEWEEHFFKNPNAIVSIERYLDQYCPSPHNETLIKGFKLLKQRGYLPIEIKALDEGTMVKPGVPVLTIENTEPEFYWLTNYLETSLSVRIWRLMHAATISKQFYDIVCEAANKTCDDDYHLLFQIHNFNFRGMTNLDDAMNTGAAHLLYFYGTDTMPAIGHVENYYGDTPMAVSVPATEHSVMCANIENFVSNNLSDEYHDGKKFDHDLIRFDAEKHLFKRLITDVYPTGIVSIVSDTFDYWRTVSEILPALKDVIMARDGKVVIRPDSGNPIDIVCGKAVVLYDYDRNLLDEDDFEYMRSCEKQYGKKSAIEFIAQKGLDRNLFDENNSLYIRYRGILHKIDSKIYQSYDSWPECDIESAEEVSSVSPEDMGTLEVLWNIFGGTINKKGYRVLDPHIGLIYGDGMDWDMIEEILQKMERQGFASSNIVFGAGSKSYQLNATRDSIGLACKAGAVVIDGWTLFLKKDPKTDPGKKSLKGYMKVIDDNGELKCIDCLGKAQAEDEDNLLRTIYRGSSINGQPDKVGWLDSKYEARNTWQKVKARAMSN